MNPVRVHSDGQVKKGPGFWLRDGWDAQRCPGTWGQVAEAARWRAAVVRWRLLGCYHPKKTLIRRKFIQSLSQLKKGKIEKQNKQQAISLKDPISEESQELFCSTWPNLNSSNFAYSTVRPQWCSKVTPRSSPRNHSYWYSGDHRECQGLTPVGYV